jgi:hypothetical protein
MLDGKLQLKDGQTIALVDNPYDLEVGAPRAEIDTADSVMVFATNRVELDQRIGCFATPLSAVPWLGWHTRKLSN